MENIYLPSYWICVAYIGQNMLQMKMNAWGILQAWIMLLRLGLNTMRTTCQLVKIWSNQSQNV